MKMTAEEYARRVKQVGPRSPLGSDCLWAFCVGGGICLLGEVLRGWYLGMGLEAQLAGTLTSCTLIVLSALLTTLGLYQKLAAKAGAGSLVPITGFANAVVSAAIEFKPEGRPKSQRFFPLFLFFISTYTDTSFFHCPYMKYRFAKRDRTPCVSGCGLFLF